MLFEESRIPVAAQDIELWGRDSNPCEREARWLFAIWLFGLFASLDPAVRKRSHDFWIAILNFCVHLESAAERP